MNKRLAAIIGICAALAGCTGTMTDAPEPTPDVERLSDVTLADDATSEDTARALAATPAETGFLGGLFSNARANQPVERTGPDARVIPYGESVAYGEIATVCDVPNGSLGTEIASVSGYKIYDTIPNAIALRPHFITGFDDGCARQFTAALSLTGDVGTHEVVRYLPTNANVPYSSTDNAYEAVKASFCRVSHGTPCGSRLDRMAANTTFITAYETFGDNPRWVEILLHDGEVKAIDFKER